MGSSPTGYALFLDLALRRRRRSGAVRETATIADTKTREKERNGEEYMACCGRTPPNSQKKCWRILLVRLSMKPSLLPEISDSTRQAAGHCYVFFLLFIIELYWTSERNCAFDPVLGKKKRKDYAFSFPKHAASASAPLNTVLSYK